MAILMHRALAAHALARPGAAAACGRRLLGAQGKQQFASNADRDRRDREAVLRAQAQNAGAAPVTGFIAAVAGLLGGGWYAGWFSGTPSKPDQMVQELHRRGIRVVAFDVDYVMSAASVGDGLPRHELGDFLAKTSQDFVPAARALAQHGFKLAVACRGEDSARKPPPPPSSAGARGASASGFEAPLLGPDVARALLSQRCPEVLPHFEAIAGFEARPHDGRPEDVGRRRHMRHIARHYRVECREVLFFGSSPEDLSNEDSWSGVLCRDKREGFRFDDLVVPRLHMFAQG